MINVAFTDKKNVLISNGEHKIISDVAKTLGGHDEGLNPHELIEAALGACTSLTLELYARRKNWDISSLKVDVKIVSEGAAGTVIDRKISFGDIPAENKERLLDIANKCPIHKLLSGNIKVETHE